MDAAHFGKVEKWKYEYIVKVLLILRYIRLKHLNTADT